MHPGLRAILWQSIADIANSLQEQQKRGPGGLEIQLCWSPVVESRALESPVRG
jgi:hypothetical protein